MDEKLLVIDPDWTQPEDTKKYVVQWWGDGSGMMNFKIIEGLKETLAFANIEGVSRQNVKIYELGKEIELKRRTENIPQPDKIKHVIEVA